MNGEQNTLTHKRRMVIGLQLGVLLFILTGLFGGALFNQKQPDNRGIDLNSVAVTKPAENEWEQLTQTEVRARAAYVLDAKTGEILYEKNGRDQLPIASITKLMTSMLSMSFCL